MTKLRGFIPTTVMMLTIIFGATAANAGIIVSGRMTTETTAIAETTSDDPCKEETIGDALLAYAEAAARFAVLGIIVSERAEKQETCGIIVSG